MAECDKKRILVIDDDDDVGAYLNAWLTDQGFEVEVAKNGMEATEKVKANKPDLITLDIVMPEKTGVRFYREMRADAETDKVPIIIITGVQHEFQLFISHRRTAPPPDGYIQKPFGRDELLSTIRQVLEKMNVS